MTWWSVECGYLVGKVTQKIQVMGMSSGTTTVKLKMGAGDKEDHEI